MSVPVIGYGRSDSKLTARIDIAKASEADDVNIDDEITVVIKGKVKRLEGPESFKDTEYLSKDKQKQIVRTLPGKIELEITKLTVKVEGEFDGMMEE